MADGNIDSIPGISHEASFKTPVTTDAYRDGYNKIIWAPKEEDILDGKLDS